MSKENKEPDTSFVTLSLISLGSFIGIAGGGYYLRYYGKYKDISGAFETIDSFLLMFGGALLGYIIALVISPLVRRRRILKQAREEAKPIPNIPCLKCEEEATEGQYFEFPLYRKTDREHTGTEIGANSTTYYYEDSYVDTGIRKGDYLCKRCIKWELNHKLYLGILNVAMIILSLLGIYMGPEWGWYSSESEQNLFAIVFLIWGLINFFVGIVHLMMYFSPGESMFEDIAVNYLAARLDDELGSINIGVPDIGQIKPMTKADLRRLKRR